MGDCIEAPGGRKSNGYGFVTIQGKQYSAHRMAYAIANKLVINTMGGIIRHTCDNRGCINPAHLVMGTHKENMRDMTDRGRQNSKLTACQVQVIRDEYIPYCREHGASSLGRRYGVSYQAICKIISGINWVNS